MAAKKPFDISAFAATLREDVSDSDTRLMEIPLSKIYENHQNFYPALPAPEYTALRDSIEANGLLEPLTVVADQDGKYRLISGHNRYRALTSLRDSQGERWERVSCLILPPMTEQQEVGAIIEANRQRKKDGCLLAREAERLTESYIARKQAGEDLPGRIRERVAEALQVSQTKLATVKHIQDHLLVPGFKERWRKGDLPEDAAYEISKLDETSQYRYLDWIIDHNKPVTAKTVKEFYREKTQPPKISPAPAAPAPVNPMERSPALSDPRLDWRTIGPRFGERLTELRKATGKSRKEFADYIDVYLNTYSAWENGNLPGSDSIPKLALALHVSTDYLFGLTDSRYTASPNAAETSLADTWRPLDADHWPEYNSLILLRGETSLHGVVYQAAHVIGSPDDQFPMEDANDHFDLDHDDLHWYVEWLPLEGKTREEAQDG